jgi:phosphoribosyl-AMP cyclohydrolase
MVNLKFNEQGLLPAILQSYRDNKVLMLGWMNKEALEKTLKTGKVHFWSRSRKELWLKGETSGHFQYVEEIWVDCDSDTLLIKVRPKGTVCHTGKETCFFRKLKSE